MKTLTTNSSLTRNMIKSASLIFFTTALLLGAGCNPLSINRTDNVNNPSVPADESSLALCGEFPKSNGDGGPTSRYSVCRNAKSESCYLKTVSPKQIPGCDPKFSDQNPYGDEKCFEYLTDTFDFTGKNLIADAKNFQPEDNCAQTTMEFFKTKVK